MLCREKSLVKDDDNYRTATPLYCRSWSCDVCAPRRLKQLRAQAIDGRPDAFLTLTIRPTDNEGPSDRARKLVLAWREVRRRAMREAVRDPRKHPQPAGPAPPEGWPKDQHGRTPRQVDLATRELPFLTVFEETRAAEPHLHVLCRVRWIAQNWLSLQMDELISSPVVHISRIKSKKSAINYVCKYISKAPGAFLACKRYWSNTTYRLTPKPPKQKDLLWSNCRKVEMTLSACARVWRNTFPEAAIELIDGVLWMDKAGAPP